MKELELLLLKMWAENGVKEIYKYKHRVIEFRKPLTNIELFYDLSSGNMFADVKDTANDRNLTAEDVKVSIETLIQNRTEAQ